MTYNINFVDHSRSRIILLFLLSFFPLTRCIEDDSSVHITSIDPEIGCPGDVISIIGWGFADSKNGNIVKLNGDTLEVLQVYTNMIVAKLSENVTSGTITVKAGGQTATWKNQTIGLSPYYVKFKAAGQQKFFGGCEPGYESTTSCAIGGAPFYNDVRTDLHAQIFVCDFDNGVSQMIETWKEAEIFFTGDYPVAGFEYFENQIKFSSKKTNAQAESKLYITDIISEPTDNGREAYRVQGTFNCNVAADFGEDIAITEGEFVLRFIVH
jgi:hypothetical protein